MGWRGFSRSSITAPGDRVGTDHVTGKIKRLQGASYPVQEASYPVRARSLTDSLHRTHARLQCRNCEKTASTLHSCCAGRQRSVGRSVPARTRSFGGGERRQVHYRVRSGSGYARLGGIFGGCALFDHAPCRPPLFSANAFPWLRFLGCALSSTRRAKTPWSFPSSATELLIELRVLRLRCRKQVRGSQPVRGFATSFSGVLE